MSTTPAAPATIDPIIPKSLVDSVKECFGIQASTPVEIVNIQLASSSEISGSDLAATIGLDSPRFTGTLAICFPTASFLGIVNRMLGEKYDSISPENADAAGELLNILYAGARVKINQAGHEFAPAIPTIVRGNEIRISHPSAQKVVCLQCKCEFGHFHVEISLKRKP